MAHEMSPICNFLFGSLSMTLPTDTLDVELMLQMVKGICMYRKDHTMESMIFTPWSIPSLRCKIQAYKDGHGDETSYNGVILFSSQPLQLHRPTQERGLLSKLEPVGVIRQGLTL